MIKYINNLYLSSIFSKILSYQAKSRLYSTISYLLKTCHFYIFRRNLILYNIYIYIYDVIYLDRFYLWLFYFLKCYLLYVYKLFYIIHNVYYTKVYLMREIFYYIIFCTNAYAIFFEICDLYLCLVNKC
jgi:hypothetical protein